MTEPNDTVPEPGAFIVVEGIDGAGSTTVTEALVDRFRASADTVFTREPTGGPVGMLIRLALAGRLHGLSPGVAGASAPLDPHAMALLFAADRRDHIASEIEPHVRAGRTVLSDRYLLSTLAYQGVDLDVDWLLSVNAHARVPDLTLFLDVDVDEAQRRMRGSRWTEDLYEGVEHQRRVRTSYEAIIRAGYEALGPIVRIDAHRPREAVVDEAAAVVASFLEARQLAGHPTPTPDSFN